MTESPATKITYATLGGDGMQDVHNALEAEMDRVTQRFGEEHGMVINGSQVLSNEKFEGYSPVDDRILLGTFQNGTEEHVREAVSAARNALPQWSALHWRARVECLRDVSEAIRRARWELSLILGYEVGKNRMECVGEVEECSDFIDYYCDRMEEHNGFVTSFGDSSQGQSSLSVLRPYGVWAVISPFNFPMALTAGPMGAALVTGNTVIVKPSPLTPLSVARLAQVISETDLPDGAFNFVTGSNEVVSRSLVLGSDIDGVVFTGSYGIGMQLMRESSMAPLPKPFIAEMGGKNPALVMESADLDKAAEGVKNSAFGLQGQKCSACSRVYAQKNINKDFIDLLLEKSVGVVQGNPLDKDVWLGPVINEAAFQRYTRAIEKAVADGGRVLTGGTRLSGGIFDHGYYVEPTVIDGLPLDHELFQKELFVPITAIAEVNDLDQAINLANSTEYGLTAGIFSEEENEVECFFNSIQAGTVYANRRAGATAGAWPGVNPFGGWKGSSSGGSGAGGPYYLKQFLREQSRLRVY
jgi:1-pyrroline-5-carboxylate dehydrogenase